MNMTLPRWSFCAGVLLALVACGKKDNSIEPQSSSTPSVAVANNAAASGASSPLPGVIPVQPDLPQTHTGTGPGSGSTAIGGMTGKQEAGGHSGALAVPTPTGGDAAPGAAK
jgi:hypothetical protein